jgi:hypothetical protein
MFTNTPTVAQESAGKYDVNPDGVREEGKPAKKRRGRPPKAKPVVLIKTATGPKTPDQLLYESIISGRPYNPDKPPRG